MTTEQTAQQPQPDPYAELKKAHAEGKVIQLKLIDGSYIDFSSSETPKWSAFASEYRIKPSPTFQLPPPPPGMRWHREDGWKEGDLPQGMRPLVAGELIAEEDECCHIALGAQWGTCHGYRGKPASKANKHPYRNADFSVYHARTRRPLTFMHEGKTWTWHRPGDPRPVLARTMVHVLMRDNDFSSHPSRAGNYEWGQIDGVYGSMAEIIGWRYADEKKTNDETIQELSDNEIIQLRSLLTLFTNLSKTLNENG